MNAIPEPIDRGDTPGGVLVYGPLGSILIDQGIQVKNKLDDTLNNFLPSLHPTRLAAYQR